LFGRNKNKQKTVEIFWTGGFDSTFRVCQLSRFPVTIKPYYLSDDRKSEELELGAIDTVTELIRNRPDALCYLRDVVVIPKDQRSEDKSINEAYKRIRKTHHLGTQYQWLGWFAKTHRGIELSVVGGDHAIELIEERGAFIRNDDPLIGESYIVDKRRTQKDVTRIFRDFSFPLRNTTKVEMHDEYERLGFGDVIELTWFCHRPIEGRPCGQCNPCKSYIEGDLPREFPPEMLERYARMMEEKAEESQISP